MEKSEVSPNELAITGLAGGEAMLTVRSGDRTLVYDVAVSPMPERLYINIFESKRLTFPGPIDDSSLSQAGIVRATQPDIADNVLLVEGIQDGKTTLTVTSKGQIYRYFISVFENRGADVLQIQNQFSAKGYRALTITFDKDQAIIAGSVPTQEELDDAVRIVRQYAEYVQVKAVLGQEMEQSEYTEQEAIIINNIQRIANVKGLIVKVKFPMPTTVTTSVQTKSVGDYIEPSTVTTPQGGTVRGSGFTPPANPNGQQNPNGGITQPHPQQNVTETTTTTEDTSIPEKIFLYGDVQDDLDEAKALRVSRTFCPFTVNFMTVRDPDPDPHADPLHADRRHRQPQHRVQLGRCGAGNHARLRRKRVQRAPEPAQRVQEFHHQPVRQQRDGIANPHGAGRRRDGQCRGHAAPVRVGRHHQDPARGRHLPDQRPARLVLGGRSAVLRQLRGDHGVDPAGDHADRFLGLPGREHGYLAAEPGQRRRHGAAGPENLRNSERNRRGRVVGIQSPSG